MWDLARIWSSIADRAGVSVADKIKPKIEDLLTRIIARYPGAGRARPELGDGLRSFPVPPYVVFYRQSGRNVRILRIRHSHQDINEPLMSLLTAM